jgi:glutamine synthetase
MDNAKDTKTLDDITNSMLVDAAGEEAVYPACRLARLLGKPAGSFTVEDLIAVVNHERIRLISLMHVGGDGLIKTLDFAPSDLTQLRNILTGGERSDGSSIFSGLGIKVGKSDIMLRPRPESAFLDPFSDEPALVVLCGHVGRDGQDLIESPDTILRAAYARLKSETGVDLYALGEVEYFIGKPLDEHSSTGRVDGGYHASSPQIFAGELRREAMVILAEMGVPIKYGHSECGNVEAANGEKWVWEQHEIELLLQPLPKAAESVALTQWVISNLASRMGFRCSFDPIAAAGHAGNGMHFHFAPVVKGEIQAVTLPNGELSDPARWLIGGLVSYGGVLMAFGNREENSFVRLAQGKEAPTSVTWGRYNRKALVRLPIIPRDASGRAVAPETVEYRLPDGSAHPHLLLAAIAQVMAAGKKIPELNELLKKTATDAAAKNPAGGSAIPKSFIEIGQELERHREVFEAGAVFPTEQVEFVVKLLMKHKV